MGHDAWVAHVRGRVEIGRYLYQLGRRWGRGEDGLAVAANGRNPHVIFHNYRRGYGACHVNRNEWRTDFRIVPFVTTPGAPLATVASFVVEDGQPAAQPT